MTLPESIQSIQPSWGSGILHTWGAVGIVVRTSQRPGKKRQVTLLWFVAQGSFKNNGANNTLDAENFELTRTYARHIGRRWYTPDFSICPTLTPRLVSRRRRNRCQVFIDGRRQLAWCRGLLQIACQRSQSLGPVVPAGLVTGNGTAAGRLWSTIPAVPSLHPVLSKTHKPALISSHAMRAGGLFPWE